MSENPKFYLKITNLRPDYRVMISLLWGDFEEVDTDGEGVNPAERDWTDLSVIRRSDDAQRIDIISVHREPLVLEISSPHPAIPPVIAYFLVHETGASWSTTPNGPYIRDVKLLEKRANHNFNLKAGMERAQSSIWRMSSLDNPYPNQRILKT